MFEDVTQKRSRWRIFWPEVTDLDSAREAIKLGCGACFVLAALNVLMATFGARSAFADAIIYAVLGLWIRRNSRAAAVIGVALMSLSVIVSVARLPLIGALTIILYVCLLSGMRGTFAYRKLIRARPSPESATGATTV